MSKLQAIRGMNDILPAATPHWQYFEGQIRSVLKQYGYQEIRLPLVEVTDLFARGVGEHTDIVEKEMYSFRDRNDESLTLRPEGTAGCVRAALQHGLLHNQVQRLWYQGPMFRYERPQKGRYRQFFQVGVETFGMAAATIDAELILLSQRLFRRLGVLDHLTLHLNTLGSSQARAQYRQALVIYLESVREQLDADSRQRLQSNPLRILDSKVASTQTLLDQAPTFDEFIDAESQNHFDQLCKLLDGAGVNYVVNRRLVRGLDYYSKTVFEWMTDALGAQGTVCGGGRYDGLIPLLGGKATPASGFAMGIERLLLLLETLGAFPADIDYKVDVYLVVAVSAGQPAALRLAESLRTDRPELRVQLDCAGGSLKSQMKKADKSGARVALILGEEELSRQAVQLKDLQGNHPQQQVAWQEVATALGVLGL